MGTVVGRRTVLAGLGMVLAGFAVREAAAEPQVVAVDELEPGAFVWHPERAPAGPVAVVVSIPDQRVYVYRNGVRIGVSTCSTGKPGHETPTGVFTILEKDKHHRSSTYNNAPMPNMNRLTWSGIALHAGNLPGYPASHGCVRLPLAFSERLFSVTTVGTPVIIAGATRSAKPAFQRGLPCCSARIPNRAATTGCGGTRSSGDPVNRATSRARAASGPRSRRYAAPSRPSSATVRSRSR